jgi:hypothetical protein
LDYNTIIVVDIFNNEWIIQMENQQENILELYFGTNKPNKPI